MRYAVELYRDRNATELYRAYVTDSLRLSAEGKYIPRRYFDLIHPELAEADDYDADKVVCGVVERAGLEVICE